MTEYEHSIRILVAEDDMMMRAAVERALVLQGYNVTSTDDGAAARSLAMGGGYDLLILDRMLPHVEGLVVCSELRSAGSTASILVLTGRVTVNDRIEGLDAGADDYMTKPFALEEMLARVRALVRRSSVAVGEPTLGMDDIRVDPHSRRAERSGVSLDLTRTEFDLLQLFARNRDVTLSRSVIYDRIWGYDFGPKSRNLDVYIGYLRRKLEHDGRSRVIHTVRGVGYVCRTSSQLGEAPTP